MKRLARIALDALSVLSSLLCIASMLLWVRSYQIHNVVEIVVSHRLTQFKTYPAHIRVGFYSFWAHSGMFYHRSSSVTPDDDAFYVPVFMISRQPYGRDFHMIVPFWLVIAITAALPAYRLVRRRVRAAPAHTGHCPACGYDLRATPNRCPECGATPTPATPTPKTAAQQPGRPHHNKPRGPAGREGEGRSRESLFSCRAAAPLRRLIQGGDFAPRARATCTENTEEDNSFYSSVPAVPPR